MIDSLIKENEWLIYEIANRYSAYYNIDDLYQAGSIGIIKASRTYKSDYNVKFSTYAYKSILGEIIDFIRKDRNIIISNEAYQIYKKYLHIKELLSSKYSSEPSFKEICSFMNIDEKDMLKIIEGISCVKSTDENEMVSSYYCSDDRDTIDDKILLNNELDKLNEFDKSLINYRYYEGYTQSETADIMGISQVKVSRQEKLILSRLKDNIIK